MDKIAILWPNELEDKEWIRSTDELLLFENIGVIKSAECASKAESLGATAIICTSGIESEVRRVSRLPIYVVTAACIDLIETLKMVENELGVQGKRIAILLHSNNPADMSRITPYIENAVERIDFTELSDIPKVFEYIQGADFDMVLTGPTGYEYAKSQGVPAFMLHYSRESIREAVSQMKTILRLSNQELLQLQKLRAVVDVSSDAIIVADADGRIDVCNARACRMFRRKTDELIGLQIDGLSVDSKATDEAEIGLHENELVEIEGKNYFVTWQPIIQGGKVVGSVRTYEEAEKIRRMENRYRALQAKGLTAKYTFDDIVYCSEEMKQTVSLAKIYAQTDMTVLIEGETGTGKEMFAQSIHNASKRRYGPFVAINCAALSESLLESELMGYEEGAFTGARRGGKIGLLELAHNGTIFLDEINQIPMHLQSKLLRVIQERSVLRIGGERMVPIDIRIITAANENLTEKVKHHEFRSDLYYRLNMLNLSLPPLRRRQDDIAELVRIFASEYGTADERLLQEMAEKARTYWWPGNIRELQNYVFRSVLLRAGNLARDWDGFIESDWNGEKDASGMISIELGTLEQMERDLIDRMIDLCGGNQSEAAKRLGVSRNTVGKRRKNDMHKN